MRSFRQLAPALLTALAVIWLAALWLAPIAMSRGRFPAIDLVVYGAGSLICHQRPERSFHLAGVQMPVCARCLGLYVAGTIGAVVAWTGAWAGASARWPARFAAAGARKAFALAATPIAISLALEWLGLIQTSNVARLLTALPLGLAAGWILIGSLIVDRPALHA